MFAPSRFRALAPFTVLALTVFAAPRPARAEGEAIRLVRRGKAGDAYKYQITTHDKGELDMSSSPDPLLQDITRSETVLQKFLGLSKDGTLRIETRRVSGTKKDVQPEKTTAETLPPFDVIFNSTPDKTNWTAKALPLPVATGKPKPLSAAAINAALKDAASFFNEPPFPTRLLRVGDTWAGVYPKNPYNKAIADDKDWPFTATLRAIETHRGVPCAKVTYIAAYKGDQASFRANIMKTAPEGSEMTGESEINLTGTAYYSLDRGEIIDSAAQIKVKYKYKVGVKIEGLDDLRVIDVEGEGNVDSSETALTFPAYDASLRGK